MAQMLLTNTGYIRKILPIYVLFLIVTGSNEKKPSRFNQEGLLSFINKILVLYRSG